MTGKKSCPKCSSSQTRYRLRTKDYQCYICGNSWEDNSEDDSEEEV